MAKQFCVHGHDTFVVGRNRQHRCCGCDNVRSANYRAANPERHRARLKAWREANPERVRAQAKAWREANPERVVAKNRAYSLFRRPLKRLEQRIAAKAERIQELEQLLRDLRGVPA